MAVSRGHVAGRTPSCEASSRSGVAGTLRQIGATVANASILVFTYIEGAVLDHPERFFSATKLLARVKSYGEPWTFGLDPGALGSYLGKRGFELIKDVSVAEVWLRYGRSVSEIRGYEFYRIASVRPGGTTGSGLMSGIS